MEDPRSQPGIRTVHLFYVVRVMVPNIVADSDTEAIEKAHELADPHSLFYDENSGARHVGSIGFSDEVQSAFVDHEGDGEHRFSTTYVEDGSGWKAQAKGKD